MEGDLAGVDCPTTIKPINKGVVHKICAGQVILDLSAAVKELVENSLDAGATSIEISLKDYGEEWFQVIDNGCGISPHNFKVLALKHHTSKLADFLDLQSLTTFGFRGEALSSLCALGNLTVETRTRNEAVATHLTFDHSGLLTTEKKTARQVGTTVTVKKLFSNLPVRSKEFHRNIRKEYGKLITLLNAYAIISKRVRLVCSNTIGKNGKSVVLKTQGSDSLKDNIINVLGTNTYTCLEPISMCISESCKMEGFISKSGYGSGRNLGDRQYLFVNGRPVDMPKVNKLVNELYKGSNSRQYPIAVMNFDIPTKAYDVNVTPDKRKIFFSEEGVILRSLKEVLEKIYSPSHVSYSVSKLEEPIKNQHTTELNPLEELELSSQQSPSNNVDLRGQLSNKEEELKADSLCRKMGNGNTCSQVVEEVVYNRNEISTRKDFTLKVHGIKKAANFSASHNTTTIHQDGDLPSDHAFFSSSALEKDSNKASCSSSIPTQSLITKFVIINKRKHENISTILSETPVLRNISHSNEAKKKLERSSVMLGSLHHYHQIGDSAEIDMNEPSNHFRVKTVVDINKLSDTGGDMDVCDLDSPPSGGSTIDAKTKQDFDNIDITMPSADVMSPALSNKDHRNMYEDLSVGGSPIQSSYAPVDPKMVASCFKGSTLQFSLKELKTRRQQLNSRLQSSKYTFGTEKSKKYAAATLELSQPDNEERKARALAIATSELERLFKKEDFGRMKVIGQFNLGFIVGKLDQDLFIVDQHAADEKYNFERLSQSTILNQQPLLRPLRLELSPEEEVVASMNLDTIRKNGFDLEEDLHALPGHHFKLKTVPFSKNITFGVEDVKELISTLADSQGECSMTGSYRLDTHDSICPPKVRAMLASRACRSSVMIGDPLGKTEMKKILENLVGLKSPWNCPHGRPTMRHLADLTTIKKKFNPDVD